jgi:hypothetical protein
MAVSKDGWFCRAPEDRLEWLGREDMALFRVLTSSDGGVCLVGSRTRALMPAELPGRTLYTINRTHLRCFKPGQPGWLLGGPTVAHAALDAGLVTEAHICHSDRHAFPLVTLLEYRNAQVYSWEFFQKHLEDAGLTRKMSTMLGHRAVQHTVWRKL